jgi:hypothetical protein
MLKRKALAMGSHQRQLGIGKVRGEEGASENAGGDSRTPCEREPEAHPTHRHDVKASFHPRHAVSHVLQDECSHDGDSGREASAWKAVPAQQRKDRRAADHRKHQPHHQRRGLCRIVGGVTLLSIGMRLVVGVLGADRASVQVISRLNATELLRR